MDGLAAASACALAAWSAVAPGVRVAEGRCGDATAWVVEVDPSAGARFVVSPPGESRTTAEFAESVGAVVAVNGGLFDARERPMGAARGGGKEWGMARRRLAAGVFGAGGGRADVVISAPISSRRNAKTSPGRVAGGPAPWMTDAVSGWPTLVDGGRPCARCCPKREPLCDGPAPRTAVAAAHGRVLLAVVAQPGLSLPELSRWLAGLGAERALNLDGGGSTSLIVDGRLLAGGLLPVPVSVAVRAR